MFSFELPHEQTKSLTFVEPLCHSSESEAPRAKEYVGIEDFFWRIRNCFPGFRHKTHFDAGRRGHWIKE